MISPQVQQNLVKKKPAIMAKLLNESYAITFIEKIVSLLFPTHQEQTLAPLRFDRLNVILVIRNNSPNTQTEQRNNQVLLFEGKYINKQKCCCYEERHHSYTLPLVFDLNPRDFFYSKNIVKVIIISYLKLTELAFRFRQSVMKCDRFGFFHTKYIDDELFVS